MFSQRRFSRSIIINSGFVKGKKADKDVRLQVLPLITHRGPMKGDKVRISVKLSNIQNHQKRNELHHKIVRALSLDAFKSWLLSFIRVITAINDISESSQLQVTKI